MARTDTIQTNTTAGEISPQMYGRHDLSQQKNGVKTLQNMVPLKWGGSTRRPGLRYVAAVKDATTDSRLIPFQVSTSQAYMIEGGNLYMRFYTQEAQLISGTPVEVATPYTSAQIRDVKFTQSADTLYLAHPEHEPRKLVRTTATSFTLSTLDAEDGPYDDINAVAADTLRTSANTGTTTITATGGHTPFVAEDVGRQIRIKGVSDWGYADITVFNSTTSVDATIVEAFDSTGGTQDIVDWRLGAWHDMPSGGNGNYWPWVPEFHDQRLFMGGITDDPQRHWGSAVADFPNFEPSASDGVVADDNAISRVIDDNQVNAIYWLVSDARGLLIGTSGGPFLAATSSQYDPVTPSNYQIRRQGTRGADSRVRPARVDSGVLYLQDGARKIVELDYSFERDKIVPEDRTLLAEHITESGIIDMAYQQEPHSILWAVRTDGVLLSFTYDKTQKVFAWARHPVGGTLTGSDQPKVKAVSTIRYNGEDQVWVIVERTVNGATVKYVEFLENFFGGDDAIEDAFFVDSGLTYSGALEDTITGLSHLEGESVSILADGAVHTRLTVTSGAIVLSYEATKVQVGLQYESVLETLPVVATINSQPQVGKPTRIVKVALTLDRTAGGSVSASTA